MKKILLILALIIPSVSFAQNETKKSQTTFEKFTSSLGSIMKFVDYELPDLKSQYANANVIIRKVTAGGQGECFLKVEFTDYSKSNYSAFIASDDVFELKKALDELKKLSENDGTGDASYLENKFTTRDNLKMGYYIEKKKSGDKAPVWFINLEGYNRSSLYFDDATALSSLFENAINKINEIK